MKQISMFVEKSPGDYVALELENEDLRRENKRLYDYIAALEDHIDEISVAYTQEFCISPEQLLSICGDDK